MKTLLDYIKEDIFDLNKDIFKIEDGYEIFSDIIMHVEDKYKISLHLQKDKVYLNGNEWIAFLNLLKSKKIKHIQLTTDLHGYYKDSGLYLNLNDCDKLDGMKIHIGAEESLHLIKKKGKCVVSNFYFEREKDNYPSLVFDVKNGDSLSFVDCLLYPYYAECSVEKLPNIKNTETDFGQLRIITLKSSPLIKELGLQENINDIIKKDILNNWDLFDIGSIQIFFRKKKDKADAICYKREKKWLYSKM